LKVDERGFEDAITTSLVETGGYPIVSAGWMTGAHHPTVTIYNHMDVQPAQEPEWTQAPFAFKNENGLYHGRGATDDKGPALSALFGARYAIEQGVPINIRFLWELEEEIGSPHFAAGLKNREAIPRPDSVVVSDTIWIAKGKPAMPYGLRGLLGARLTLRNTFCGKRFLSRSSFLARSRASSPNNTLPPSRRCADAFRIASIVKRAKRPFKPRYQREIKASLTRIAAAADSRRRWR
jgi:hypothetical protein